MSIDRPHREPDKVELLAEAHKEDIQRIEQLDVGTWQQNAQLILVLLGEQPAVDIFVYPNDGPPEKTIQVLQRAGLSVKVGHHNRRGTEITMLFVARTPQTADDLMRASPLEGSRTEHEAYARLMGFPQTAIDAFLGRIPKLSKDEQDALDDPSIIFGMIYSKEHWKDELEFERKRSMLVKKYAPRLYAKILSMHEE